LTLQAGAHLYHKMPPTAFDDDWGIGHEPALRWFCRACATRQELTDHQACGNPTYDPRRETVTRSSYMLDVNSGEFNSKTNGVYFTPNLFYRWRNQRHLNGFTSHWLEIDTNGHKALTESEANKVLQEVTEVLWRADLPAATSIVTTGSGGVHLYWMYDEPQMTRSVKHREKLLERWREISRCISARFEEKRKELGYSGWSVDFAASHNPSGNMRLPSSLHHKTWREVEYYRGGKKIAPQALVSHLGFKWKYPCSDDYVVTVPRDPRPQKNISLQPLVVRNAVEPSKEKVAGVAQGFDSGGQQYWMKGLLRQWADFLAMTRPDLKGQRDLTAFHIYNMANRVMGASDAWKYVEQLNKKYIGLTDNELKGYLSTAASNVYYYGMSRLVHILGTELGLPLDFSYSKKQAKLGEKEVGRRQVRSGRTSARKKSQRSFDRLVEDIHAYVEKHKVTPTQIKLSKKLRASVFKASRLTRATFYRHLPNALQAVMQKVQVTLADLKLLAENSSLIRSPLSYNAVGDGFGFLDLGSFIRLDRGEYAYKVFNILEPPD